MRVFRQNCSQVSADRVDVTEVGRKVAHAQGCCAADTHLRWIERHALHILARLRRVQTRNRQYLLQRERQGDGIEWHDRRCLAARNLITGDGEQRTDLKRRILYGNAVVKSGVGAAHVSFAAAPIANVVSEVHEFGYCVMPSWVDLEHAAVRCCRRHRVLCFALRVGQVE